MQKIKTAREVAELIDDIAFCEYDVSLILEDRKTTVETLNDWLQHKPECNIERDDGVRPISETIRCTCGLDDAINQRLEQSQ